MKLGVLEVGDGIGKRRLGIVGDLCDGELERRKQHWHLLLVGVARSLEVGDHQAPAEGDRRSRRSSS